MNRPQKWSISACYDWCNVNSSVGVRATVADMGCEKLLKFPTFFLSQTRRRVENSTKSSSCDSLSGCKEFWQGNVGDVVVMAWLQWVARPVRSCCLQIGEGGNVQKEHERKKNGKPRKGIRGEDRGGLGKNMGWIRLYGGLKRCEGRGLPRCRNFDTCLTACGLSESMRPWVL